MTLYYNVNNVDAAADIAKNSFYGLKVLGIAHNWTVPLSSNGVIYASAQAAQTLDNAAAADAGGGEVTIDLSGHGFKAGERVTIAGTTNYNGDFWVQSVNVGDFNITSAYTAETFAGTETAIGTGDVIQDADDLTDADCFYVFQGPVGRQWLFSMDGQTNLNEWNVAFSTGGNFTGGTASARPTATDQKPLFGSMGSGTVNDFFPTVTTKWHCMVDDTVDNLILAAFINSSNIPCTLILGDTLTETNALDTDPHVAGAYYNASYSCMGTSTPGLMSGYNSTWDGAAASGMFGAWYAYGLAGEVWQDVYGCFIVAGFYLSYIIAPASPTTGGGTDAWDGTDNGYPLIYGRSTLQGHGTAFGIKGFSTMLRSQAVSGRAAGDTLDIASAGAKDRFQFGTNAGGANVSMPWNGTNPI